MTPVGGLAAALRHSQEVSLKEPRSLEGSGVLSTECLDSGFRVVISLSCCANRLEFEQVQAQVLHPAVRQERHDDASFQLMADLERRIHCGGG